MKKIIYIIIVISLLGCELGKRLDMQDMGESPGYFLECYLIPGELYNLTATFLLPISVPQLLDYSLEFDVYIQGDERIDMLQSLYFDEEKNFFYNYASPLTVEKPKRNYFELYAVSPTGEKIYGKTEVPDQVKIEKVWYENNNVYYTFHLSEDSSFDYYYTSAYFTDSRDTVKKVFDLNDFSSIEEKGEMTLSLSKPTKLSQIKEIRVELKRMTRDNYKYQVAIRELINANEDNVTSPIMLPSNLTESLGIFTCYTEDKYTIEIE